MSEKIAVSPLVPEKVEQQISAYLGKHPKDLVLFVAMEDPCDEHGNLTGKQTLRRNIIAPSHLGALAMLMTTLCGVLGEAKPDRTLLFGIEDSQEGETFLTGNREQHEIITDALLMLISLTDSTGLSESKKQKYEELLASAVNLFEDARSRKLS